MHVRLQQLESNTRTCKPSPLPAGISVHLAICTQQGHGGLLAAGALLHCMRTSSGKAKCCSAACAR